MTPEQRRIITQIEQDAILKDSCLPMPTLPKPHVPNGKVRAIVLGADPSTRDGIPFDHVFGLGGRDRRYFAWLARNLTKIGLTLDNVFVQNVVQNYCKAETSRNRNWQKLAKLWLPELKRDLDQRYSRNIPVLISAGKIYFALREIEEEQDFDFSNLYESHFTPPEANVLGRRLYPFFRHGKYDLGNWSDYAEWVKGQIQ